MQIKMPYIGGVLSKNGYKLLNHGTKPIVKKWKRELADKIERLGPIESPTRTYQVGVRGHFSDGRRPDMQNLFEVISDSVQMGLNVNDKHFTLVDNGYETGYLKPQLIITIEGVE